MSTSQLSEATSSSDAAEGSYTITTLVFLDTRANCEQGANLISCGGNGWVRFWNSTTCTLLGEFIAHQHGMCDLLSHAPITSPHHLTLPLSPSPHPPFHHHLAMPLLHLLSTSITCTFYFSCPAFLLSFPNLVSAICLMYILDLHCSWQCYHGDRPGE